MCPPANAKGQAHRGGARGEADAMHLPGGAVPPERHACAARRDAVCPVSAKGRKTASCCVVGSDEAHRRRLSSCRFPTTRSASTAVVGGNRDAREKDGAPAPPMEASPCSPTLPAGRRARTAFRSSAGGSTVASMPRQPGGCAPCSSPGLPSTPARPSRACPMKPLPLNMATKGNVPLSRGTWTDTASPLRWPPRSSPPSRMVASCDPTR